MRHNKFRNVVIGGVIGVINAAAAFLEMNKALHPVAFKSDGAADVKKIYYPFYRSNIWRLRNMYENYSLNNHIYNFIFIFAKAFQCIKQMTVSSR